MTTMAELFKDRGYATGAFVAAYFLDSKWGLNQGFDTYYDKFDLSKFKKVSLGSVQRPANEVMDKALPWLESQKDGRFFAWIHLYDPHTPYEPPPPYDALMLFLRPGGNAGPICLSPETPIDTDIYTLV